MAKNVLYYPFMSAPSYDWVKQALLYGDRLGFISPDILKQGAFSDRLSDFLYRSGLLEEIIPSDELDSAFSDKFLTALENDLSHRKNKIEYNMDFEIWGGKFLNGIQTYFEKNKIIKDSNNSNLFRIDGTIGKSYIS